LVYRCGQLVDTFESSSPIEVGRRDLGRNEPAPFSAVQQGNIVKLVLADANAHEVARRWFKIASDLEGRIVIENIHQQLHLSISNGPSISSGERRSFEQDVLVMLSDELAIRVKKIASDQPSEHDEFRALDGNQSEEGEFGLHNQTTAIRKFAAIDAKEIAKMLRIALNVVEQAAGTDAFFNAAAAAAAQIVELDRVMILLRDTGKQTDENATYGLGVDGWNIVAQFYRSNVRKESSSNMSRTILQRVASTGKTVIHDPDHRNVATSLASFANVQSLMRVRCATASPILDSQRNLIGILYGDRWTDENALDRNRISDIEATLVEILASAVAGGIARKAEERMRSTLSEFFSPKVANLLASDPKLMDGQDAQISVLFCDIRGFSSVTEKLGPQKAIEWINDVMSDLSQCVIDSDGVLVDYVGDELMAMWGAPVCQLDHAQRALDAARAMMKAIEKLRLRWSSVLPQRFGAGIGINTGPARVGNVGSRQKFKYGALGNTVNVGSRLQSATKQLGIDCIASGETVHAAGQVASCRRITKLSVVGIDQAVEVYEVVGEKTDSWEFLSKSYDLALVDFEAKRFGEAARRIGELIQTYPNDRPSKKLLSRAVKELDEPSDNFSPMLTLTQK